MRKRSFFIQIIYSDVGQRISRRHKFFFFSCFEFSPWSKSSLSTFPLRRFSNTNTYQYI